MIKSNPLVSIIIPCYNSEKHVSKTIESVFNQTYSNIEIIVVDDGSTDKTLQKINELFSKANYKYKVITQKNQGVSVARNTGLNNARGSYIVFLDSDDFIEIDFVEKMIDKALKLDLDVVFCAYDYVDDTDRILSTFNKNYNNQYGYIEGKCAVKELLKNNISIQTINAIIKKDILDMNNILYYPGCHYGEDLEFIIKYLYNSNRVGWRNEVLVHYYQSNTSAMHTFSRRRFTGIGALNRIKKYILSYIEDIEIRYLVNNRKILEYIYIYSTFIKSNNCHDDRNYIIFKNISKKFRNEFKCYKIMSRKDFLYKILITIFCINPKLYAYIFKFYTKNIK